MQSVSKWALQWYSKCYCVLQKRLHLKAYKVSIVQHLWNTIVKLFLKHPALPVEVTLNRNYPR
jgi:hypothetical protein